MKVSIIFMNYQIEYYQGTEIANLTECLNAELIRSIAKTDELLLTFRLTNN